MGINLNNYEAYFLDYKEGNLATEKVAELMVFLEAHPELKSEFESFELFHLEPGDPIQFDNKKSLKKKVFEPTQNINDDNYEEWLVANLEGDLTNTDKLELDEFIEKNPTVKLEQNVFKSTILKPDVAEYFNKRELKKTGVFLLYRTPIIYAASIAASLLLFFSLFFNQGNYPDNSFTKVDKINGVQSLDANQIVIEDSELRKIELVDNFAMNINAKEPERIELAAHDNKITQLAYARSVALPAIESPTVYYVDNRYEHSVIFADNQLSPLTNDKSKSFFGRFLASVTSNLIPANSIQKKSFLEYTVEGYNLMADREVEVEKQFDDSGKLSAVNVDGEVINLSRKVRNRQ